MPKSLREIYDKNTGRVDESTNELRDLRREFSGLVFPEVFLDFIGRRVFYTSECFFGSNSGRLFVYFCGRERKDGLLGECLFVKEGNRAIAALRPAIGGAEQNNFYLLNMSAKNYGISSDAPLQLRAIRDYHNSGAYTFGRGLRRVQKVLREKGINI